MLAALPAVIAISSLAWLFDDGSVAPTPAQDVAAELARYSREEKAVGRRGPIFFNLASKLDEHRLKWTEAQLVDALGTPDGMQRKRSWAALMYKFGDAVNDQIAVVKISWGVVDVIGYNSLSPDDQFIWAPYRPPAPGASSGGLGSASSQPKDPG